MRDRAKQQPLAPVDQYTEVRPLLRHIRIMRRFLDEVVDENPELRKHYSELHGAYMDILNEELAPHALTFALAVTELEDAYPEIDPEAEFPMPGK
jgi:predicted nuclease with TOPRIM domain